MSRKTLNVLIPDVILKALICRASNGSIAKTIFLSSSLKDADSCEFDSSSKTFEYTRLMSHFEYLARRKKLSQPDKSTAQSHAGGRSRRDLVIVSVLIIASVLVAVFAAVEAATTSVSMSGTVKYNGAQTADAEFQGIGNYYVDAQCFNVNATLRCPLLISMSLTTPDNVLHDNLYTRTMTLKVVNGQGTVLAFEMDQYTSPATTYQVTYGLDESLSRFITITTPSNVPGSTWTFKIILLNPPVVNGSMALQIDGQAQVVDTHFLGRTYNLDTGIMQLSDHP